MTSKESLEMYHRVVCDQSVIVDDSRHYETIKKDLDVLDMLKKKMRIETDYYDSDDGCEEFEYIVYNGEALNIDTQEEFNKIKEWLNYE